MKIATQDPSANREVDGPTRRGRNKLLLSRGPSSSTHELEPRKRDSQTIGLDLQTWVGG
jgi:hypothetical protein